MRSGFFFCIILYLLTGCKTNLSYGKIRKMNNFLDDKYTNLSNIITCFWVLYE